MRVFFETFKPTTKKQRIFYLSKTEYLRWVGWSRALLGPRSQRRSCAISYLLWQPGRGGNRDWSRWSQVLRRILADRGWWCWWCRALLRMRREVCSRTWWLGGGGGLAIMLLPMEGSLACSSTEIHRPNWLLGALSVVEWYVNSLKTWNWVQI